ncbi:MAG: TetR family transcriptional regulator [Polyangia bacterium]
MGRPSNLESRRAQVADALVRLLATGSFAEISVAELAREAGVAPGLVHHYFRDKEAVLLVAVERMTVGLEVRLVERLRAAGGVAKARVHAFIDAWLSPDAGANPRAAFAWVAIGDEARRRPDVQALYVAAFERAIDRLRLEVSQWLSPLKHRRAGKIARVVMIAIEGALRVGAAGALEAGSAAPLVRGIVDALVAESANPTDLEDGPARTRR